MDKYFSKKSNVKYKPVPLQDFSSNNVASTSSKKEKRKKEKKSKLEKTNNPDVPITSKADEILISFPTPKKTKKAGAEKDGIAPTENTNAFKDPISNDFENFDKPVDSMTNSSIVGATTATSFFIIAIVVSLIALGIGAAGLTMGAIGYSNSIGNTVNNITNNYTIIEIINGNASNGTVSAIIGGEGIIVNSSNASFPIISFNQTSIYPVVKTITPGVCIDVNSTDPENLIISSNCCGVSNQTCNTTTTGGVQGISGTNGIIVDSSNASYPIISFNQSSIYPVVKQITAGNNGIIVNSTDPESIILFLNQSYVNSFVDTGILTITSISPSLIVNSTDSKNIVLSFNETAVYPIVKTITAGNDGIIVNSTDQENIILFLNSSFVDTGIQTIISISPSLIVNSSDMNNIILSFNETAIYPIVKTITAGNEGIIVNSTDQENIILFLNSSFIDTGIQTIISISPSLIVNSTDMNNIILYFNETAIYPIVKTITAGNDGIIVNSTDQENIILFLNSSFIDTGIQSITSISPPIIVNSTDVDNVILSFNESALYPLVKTITRGNNGIIVNSTDTQNIIISLNDTYIEPGVLTITGISPIVVNDTDPQNVIISFQQSALSDPKATLYNNGNAGDLFFLSNRNNSFGLYRDPQNVYMNSNVNTGNGRIINTDSVTDSSDNIYTCGMFDTSSIIIGSNTIPLAGSTSLFVTKTDSSFNYLWSAYNNGTGTILSSEPGSGGVPSYLAIAKDNSNNIYVTGSFTGNISFGSNFLRSTAASDCFVAKLNANTGAWISAFQTNNRNSSDFCTASDIKVDNNGNIFVSGFFQGQTYFGSTIISNGYLSGTRLGFLSKANSSGSWLWAIQTNTNQSGTTSKINSIQLDSQNNIISYLVFITSVILNGTFYGVVPSSGVQGTLCILKNNNTNGIYISISCGNIYTANSNPSLPINGFITQNVISNSMIIDSSDNVYVCGSFSGYIDFGPSFIITTQTPTGPNANAIFIIKFSSSFAPIWSLQSNSILTSLGGFGFAVQSISLSPDEQKIALSTQLQLPLIIGNYYLNPSYNQILISTASTNGNWSWSLLTEPSKATFTDNNAYSCNFLSDNSIFISGRFSNNIDLFPSLYTTSRYTLILFRVYQDGSQLVDQFAMLAESGTTGNQVYFTSVGLVENLSGLVPGAYYNYVQGVGFTTQKLFAYAPIGFAMSATQFYMTPGSYIY